MWLLLSSSIGIPTRMYDNLFYTKGIHSIKFGANLERLQGNTFGARLSRRPTHIQRRRQLQRQWS